MISLIGLLGFAMFGAINFLPLFQQTVQGASATNSGLLLLPMMAAAMTVSLFVGTMITRTGRYKAFPVVGGAVMAVAMFLLSRQDVHTSSGQTGMFIGVLGLGMGFLMQTTMLIAQNSVSQKDIGVASSSATFFRSIVVPLLALFIKEIPLRGHELGAVARGAKQSGAVAHSASEG